MERALFSTQNIDGTLYGIQLHFIDSNSQLQVVILSLGYSIFQELTQDFFIRFFLPIHWTSIAIYNAHIQLFFNSVPN